MTTDEPKSATTQDHEKPRRRVAFGSDIGQATTVPTSSRRVFGWVISGLLISVGLYLVLNLSCDGPGAGAVPVQSDGARR